MEIPVYPSSFNWEYAIALVKICDYQKDTNS